VFFTYVDRIQATRSRYSGDDVFKGLRVFIVVAERIDSEVVRLKRIFVSQA
jgi:hypothetical protein